ncbi:MULTISPECIES: entericidin A/B family lipoprotein [Neptunomonas]|uniref:Entericidin A/B family lipoprotein n=1 Tax=Neptunomonas marina TaxID=1815562 RepID=A0A437QCE4_9GAMM|nr:MULTISPECIES: entericidin A/B family lipoprotein [Neptunomonas]RVU32220.1 entericidin A/B family lipoprotein [Neptunomonas marina]
MKKQISAVVALLLVVAVSGCSTVEGLGKDIRKGGQAIEKAAKDNS